MLKIAWRNLWRNRTRTLITATAIALAYALYLMANGIQDWTFDEMRAAAAKAAGGHVLVQKSGYLDTQENDLLLADGEALLAAVRTTEGVESAAGRVLVQGLLSTSASSGPVQLSGIDPVAEATINDMHTYLERGEWVDPAAEAPLVLGKGLARELEVDLGDRVILTATDAGDEMNRALFHVSGIISTGSEMTDRALAFTNVAAAQRAIGAPGRLTQIGIVTREERRVLAARVASRIAAPDVESLPWDVAMPDLVGFIEMKKGGGAFFGFVLFLVVLFAIMNTFMMIVMERIREFGLVGALGLTPRQTAAVLLLETASLALVAMLIGLVLALFAHTLIATHGIDFAALYGDSLDVQGVSLADTTIYSRIDPLRWMQTSLAVFVMVLVAAIYPAIKASRLRPAEAMRFYE